MRINIHIKFTLAFCVVLAVVLGGVFLYLDDTFRDYVHDRIKADLLKEARLVKLFLEEDFPPGPSLRQTDALVDRIGETIRSRVTIIGLDGNVLGDSELDGRRLRELENHLYRPEVQQAIHGGSGTGQSSRFSTTVQKTMVYTAVMFGREQPEGIVRLSLPLTEVHMVTSRLKKTLGVSIFLAFLFAGMISFLASRRISKPLQQIIQTTKQIAKGDFTRKIAVSTGDEVEDLAGAVNDMSEQIKQRIDIITSARTRFEAILLNMVEGVMVVDARGRINLINPELMSILNVSSDPAGRKPLEVLRNIEVQEMVDRMLQGKTPAESREITARIREERIFLVNAAPVKRDGGIEGAVLVFHDITELRNLEKMRREFVANVSHELRTPAANIKGYSETLLDGALKDPEHAEEFIRIINADADRLAVLISDLLDLSRIESGKLEMEFIPCSLKRMVERAADQVKPLAREKDIKVMSEVPDGFCVSADEARITQALLNVLDNAVKYTQEGGRVWITAADLDGDRIKIDISDNGPGIARKDLPRIFERFYRVDKARSRELGGTGLGLSIVKHIVQEHNGKIFVESTPGRGSIFSITLPGA